MRVVPLLILFVCGLSVSAAPERPVANELPIAAAPAGADEVAGQAQYLALQAQAVFALDLLKQARERRLASAQLAAN